MSTSKPAHPPDLACKRTVDTCSTSTEQEKLPTIDEFLARQKYQEILEFKAELCDGMSSLEDLGEAQRRIALRHMKTTIDNYIEKERVEYEQKWTRAAQALAVGAPIPAKGPPRDLRIPVTPPRCARVPTTPPESCCSWAA